MKLEKIINIKNSKIFFFDFTGILFGIISAISAELILGHIFTPQDLSHSIGRTIIVFLSLIIIERVGFELIPGVTKRQNKDVATLTFILVLFIVIEFGGREVCRGLVAYLENNYSLKSILPESLYFAIPLAAGGILVQTVLGINYGIVFGVAISIIVGVYTSNIYTFLYVLTSILVACITLKKVNTRSAYLYSGINIAVFSFLFALFSIISNPFIENAFFYNNLICAIISSLLSGVFSVLVASGFAPIIENIGGYATDIRLIEIATLDHSLLKELSVQAAGTWNHSVVMGMMAEAAAESIGANSTLSRVAAYFHDIGKLKKPLYFVENQIHGENKHDKLSPSMSALIIRSHVKDGVEFAKKYKLPSVLQDMILQHHGTSVIEYFYDKALKENENLNNTTAVDESLYSYPGPKPQTREAGILMLADGIEAASRTLSDTTQDRIQGMVQKMINKVFSSGQLNECNLTLKDLHSIAKQFTRILSGIHHQRIAYTESAEKSNKSSEINQSNNSKNSNILNDQKNKEMENTDNSTDKNITDKNTTEKNHTHKNQSERNQVSETLSNTDKESSKENLKRLGL